MPCRAPPRVAFQMLGATVDPALRGTGAGRKLIEAVAGAAKAYGAGRVYWLTQDSNAVARQLYDRLAANRGFIRYDFTG